MIRGGVLVCLLALLALAGSAPGALAAAKRKPPTLSVRVVTISQRTVLRKHALRIRVYARHSARVRLFGLSRRAGHGQPLIAITASRVVRVRARHPVYAYVRLSRAGTKEISGCAQRTVTGVASTVRSTALPPGPRFRSSRRLRVDRIACRPKHGHPGGGGSTGTGGGSTTPPAQEQKPRAFSTPSDSDRCDFTDMAVCLQPWPNDYFTTNDATTQTNRRLNLNLQSMPKNKAGKPIDPTDFNRNDGFSPGDPIVTKVPKLDNPAAFSRSGIVPLTDMAQAYRETQPVVVINTATRARHLAWAELDANPKNPADVNLIIRPGKNFQEGQRYIVALRNLKDSGGHTLTPAAEFRLYRDRVLTTNPQVEKRRKHFESLFQTLTEAGIDRDSLYRTWDFTVASERNLSERMLSIRNDAFKQLGDTNLSDLKVQGSSPTFKVTGVKNETDPNQNIARTVEGTVTVPCYISTPTCAAGGRFIYPPNSTTGLPQRIPGNTTEARFTCKIPRVALQNGGARPGLYGHGLFGSRGEVGQGQLQQLSQGHDFVFCATEWIGMACGDLPDPPTDQNGFLDFLNRAQSGQLPNAPDCDIPNVATILTDLSNFPTLTDRVQQGLLNFMYIGRAMIHPNGMRTNAAFKRANGQSVFDSDQRLYYDGNSQGGIIGGALAAFEPDLDHAVLGVPGMNYSTLLQRSTDFGTGQPPHPDPTNPESVIPEYAYPLYQSYPNELQRPMILSLIQNLWDRSEADGYAQHMTNNPYPNTPAHQILMHGGLGDHQVGQITAETEARTIGAYARKQYTDPGRDRDKEPGYGIPRITSFPFDGSAYMIWDIGPRRTEGGEIKGTDPPPASNTPPADNQEDPHEAPRRTVNGMQQKSDFLRPGGKITEVCGLRPCYAGTWHGP